MDKVSIDHVIGMHQQADRAWENRNSVKLHSEDLEASHARLHDAQEDLKGILRTLARQVESLQGGAHSRLPQTENSASVVMDVDDLKNKVARLMERVEHSVRGLDAFVRLRNKVLIIEGQIEYWQHRLPRRHLAEDLEEIQSSIELQAEFQEFKQNSKDRVWQLRHAIEHLDAQTTVLQSRFSTDSWEVLSDRIASKVSRMSATLNKRVAEGESSNSSPAKASDQTRIVQEELLGLDSRVDVSLRAFSREVEELED